MKTDTAELTLKKQTLEAWTHILFRQGIIDTAKCGRMISEIRKLRA